MEEFPPYLFSRFKSIKWRIYFFNTILIGGIIRQLSQQKNLSFLYFTLNNAANDIVIPVNDCTSRKRRKNWYVYDRQIIHERSWGRREREFRAPAIRIYYKPYDAYPVFNEAILSLPEIGLDSSSIKYSPKFSGGQKFSCGNGRLVGSINCASTRCEE